MPTEKPRVTITMTDEQKKQIEDFQFSYRLKNTTQAILTLLKIGLDEYTDEKVAGGKVVISDARSQMMIELYEQLDDTDKADLYRHGRLMLLQDKYKKIKKPSEEG